PNSKTFSLLKYFAIRKSNFWRFFFIPAFFKTAETFRALPLKTREPWPKSVISIVEVSLRKAFRCDFRISYSEYFLLSLKHSVTNPYTKGECTPCLFLERRRNCM